jgi:hypothetical protein
MVIFHSYVSLPEGKGYNHDKWEGLHEMFRMGCQLVDAKIPEDAISYPHPSEM